MTVIKTALDDDRLSHPGRDPVDAILGLAGPGVLAIITHVEGPSYRPVGAVMTIAPDGNRFGSLSSGCIEADIALHALEQLASGKPRSIRYGRGSPYIDLTLPCGGGLDILLLPAPDLDILQALQEKRRARQPASLVIDTSTGAIRLDPAGETGFEDGRFRLAFTPEPRFLVFGKGPEATTFSALARSAGFDQMLYSPDRETLQIADREGTATTAIQRPGLPAGIQVDAWTAIVLFFHDHDWEPAILQQALETDAFYIGAQGSQRARDNRLLALKNLGVTDMALERLHGPIGLIPSTRDARSLAVSVLAEIVSIALPRLRS